MVEKTVPGAAFYNLSLIGMEYPWQAYVVNVESDNCVNQNGKMETGVAMFITPICLIKLVFGIILTFIQLHTYL